VDVYVIYKYGKKASISAWSINYAKKHPIFPFTCGVIMGHIFWSMSSFDYLDIKDLNEKCSKIKDSNE
jgi:hypothetical protein